MDIKTLKKLLMDASVFHQSIKPGVYACVIAAYLEKNADKADDYQLTLTELQDLINKILAERPDQDAKQKEMLCSSFVECKKTQFLASGDPRLLEIKIIGQDHLTYLINLLHDSRLLADDKIPYVQRLKAICALSLNNIKRLYELCYSLHQEKLLDWESYETVFVRITASLPKVQEVAVMKLSRKLSHEPRTEYSVVSQGLSLFIKPRPESALGERYEGGGGQVRKAYDGMASDTVVYGIKTPLDLKREPDVFFKETKSNLALEAQQMIEREARYYQMLGREAFYSNSASKVKLFYPWLQGTVLNEVPRKTLLGLSLTVRLGLFIHALGDLNIFHLNYRAHGDIKPGNLIVNLITHTMKLIDFDQSHKPGSKKEFFGTLPFNSDTYDNMSNDMYGMGIVAAALFPEYFTVNYPVVTFLKKVEVKPVQQAQRSIMANAIITLVNRLLDSECEKTPASVDVMKYCQLLCEQGAALSLDKVGEIESATISRKTTTVEDVLRGVSCGP